MGLALKPMLPFGLTLQQFSFSHRNISLYVPEPQEMKALFEAGRIEFPYWSGVWPSALALSEFLSSEQNLVKGKTIMEVGAGLALPSFSVAGIVKKIILSDQNEMAVEVMQKNIQYHQLNHASCIQYDWVKQNAIPDVDVVLMSDVNYHHNLIAPLIGFIHQLQQGGTQVILATPQRIIGREFMNELLSLDARRTTLESRGQAIDIMVLG